MGIKSVQNVNLHDDRIGEERCNKSGCLMKIIEYNGNNDLIVEFQDDIIIQYILIIKVLKMAALEIHIIQKSMALRQLEVNTKQGTAMKQRKNIQHGMTC